MSVVCSLLEITLNSIGPDSMKSSENAELCSSRKPPVSFNPRAFARSRERMWNSSRHPAAEMRGKMMFDAGSPFSYDQDQGIKGRT